MKKKKWIQKYVVFVILFLIITVCFFAAESRAEVPDYASLWQNIALSIACSIVASALFCILQNAEEKDQEEQINEIQEKLNNISEKLSVGHMDEVEEGLKRINENLKRNNELYDSGIRSIRKKSYYDRDGLFWKNIIESTYSRMDLIGHSISKWFDEEYREIFVKKIEEMIRNEKEVRIILSGETPDMEKVRRVEERGKANCNDALTKMENTCYELRQIVRNVPKEVRGKLKVYIMESAKVTYMYIRTDQQCFISPYIYSETNNSNSFLLELRTRIDYSKCFDDDFQEMIRCNTRIVDLEG